MFLMAEQYSVELMIEAGGKRVPSPMMKFWRESLADLSPLQMREGLKGYMASERRHFKPTPEDIKENCADLAATDKPRLVINKDCEFCGGDGWCANDGRKKSQVSGRDKVVMMRCNCRQIVYAGQRYQGQPKLLPSAPPDNTESANIMAELSSKLPDLKYAVKVIPAERRGLSDSEYNQRQQELERQKKLVEQKFQRQERA